MARIEDAVLPALRVTEDRARGRRWELGWGTVSAYDVASERLVRNIDLPGATLSGAREGCLPDMLIGRLGALIVSSNAQPTFWRISPERYEIERYDIELDSDQDKDVGFSGLAWSADESTLYAVSAATGTLWRIDLASGKGRKIELSEPVYGACGIALAPPGGPWQRATTLVLTIGQTQQTQLVALLPDMARGTVRARSETDVAATD